MLCVELECPAQNLTWTEHLRVEMKLESVYKMSSYLFRFAPGDEGDVSHVTRDEDHRGESHEPADALTPHWEHVVIHCQRNHLDGTEQKHSLKKRRLGRVWERGYLLSKLIYLSSLFFCSSKLQTLENRDRLSKISAPRKSSLSMSGFAYGSHSYV